MPIDLKSLAREGARKRIQELLEELAALKRSFPDLSERRPSALRVNSTVAPQKRRGRRTPMTPAQRKAVGIRMKAYWAARRKASAKS